jgi:hypothetical protein
MLWNITIGFVSFLVNGPAEWQEQVQAADAHMISSDSSS